jgi:hypothetical protein
VIPKKSKNFFWSVVEECLKVFHGLPEGEAHARAATLREKLAHSSRGRSEDLIYHQEPFYVACDLMRRPLEVTPYQVEYDRIWAAQMQQDRLPAH